MRRILALFVLAILLELTGASRALAQVTTGSITDGGSTCVPGDGRCVQLDLNNELWNTIFIGTTGAWTGTNTIEFLPIGSTTWATATCIDLLSSNYGGAVTTFTGNKNLICANRIYQAIRIRGTNGHTGTLTVAMRAAAVNGIVGLDLGGGSSTIGTVNQGTAGADPWVVSCSSGCAASKTDDDDASIAAAQTGVPLALSLNQVFDGTVWRRQTIGVAGTAAAQVYTVQGIASMTPLLATLSGTNNINNVSGTVSLPTGAATAANQTTENTSLASIKTDADALATCVGSGGGTCHVTIDNGGTTDTDDGDSAAGQSGAAVVIAVPYGYDGTSNKRVRAKGSRPGSSEVGQVTRPFVPTDGTNDTPTMDAVGRPGFQKITDGTNVYADPCAFLAWTVVPINQTASSKPISAASSKKNYICALVAVVQAAEVINVVEGTGSTCGTSTAAVVGSTTASQGLSFAANGGFVVPVKIPGIGTNVDTCLTQSGSSRVSGYLAYVQQ